MEKLIVGKCKGCLIRTQRQTSWFSLTSHFLKDAFSIIPAQHSTGTCTNQIYDFYEQIKPIIPK